MNPGEFKTAKKAIGIKQVVKALKQDAASKVFIAADADRRVLKELIELCECKSMAVETAESMQELGRLCGIHVGAASVAFLRV